MNPEQRRRAGALTLFLAVLTIGASAAVRFPLAPGLAASLCFVAVIAAALLISWGAEAAQFFVSQGLAVAVIALLQVVPEFMVEAVIAWRAGKDGRIDLVFANATGSNRLLTGFGWPLVFLVTDFFHRRKGRGPLRAIELRVEHVVEVVALLAASLWYLVILAKRSLGLGDTIVLGGGFFLYLWVLHRLPSEEEEEVDELIAPARALATTEPARRRTALILSLFALGGVAMWAVADPFLTAMKEVALAAGVSQFAFVQWVAPFLTEFPEKVTAVYWARTVKLAPMALLNLISSTVSQYTALVAMIPLAFALSAGRATSIPMEGLHRVELFLSFATTLYGVACLAKLRFTRGNANVMLALFLVQFLYQGPIDLPNYGSSGFHLTAVRSHIIVAWAYVACAAAELAVHRREVRLLSALRQTFAHLRR